MRNKKPGRPRTACTGKFGRWLDSQVGVTYEALAADLDCSVQVISNLRAGRVRPGRELANKIAVRSGGAVAADSWDGPQKRKRAA
jgi:hypothetical protein